MQKWEYRVVTNVHSAMEVRLNKMGQEGWELVSVISSGNPAQFIMRRPSNELSWHLANSSKQSAPEDDLGW